MELDLSLQPSTASQEKTVSSTYSIYSTSTRGETLLCVPWIIYSAWFLCSLNPLTFLLLSASSVSRQRPGRDAEQHNGRGALATRASQINTRTTEGIQGAVRHTRRDVHTTTKNKDTRQCSRYTTLSCRCTTGRHTASTNTTLTTMRSGFSPSLGTTPTAGCLTFTPSASTPSMSECITGKERDLPVPTSSFRPQREVRMETHSLL